MNENHYVVVYDQSLSEVYMNTDILVEDLSAELQEEIIQMKYVENEKNYSIFWNPIPVRKKVQERECNG